jgi:hypothetical protein
MNLDELNRCAVDPAFFRSRLLVETDRGARPLGDVLDDWQKADFEALDSAWKRVAGLPSDGGKQRAYLERPRGHSKTSDLAVMVAWALAFSRRSLRGIAAAASSDQAGLLREAIGRLCRLNPWLAEMLEVQRYRVVNRNPKSGSELEIMSSDEATASRRTSSPWTKSRSGTSVRACGIRCSRPRPRRRTACSS